MDGCLRDARKTDAVQSLAVKRRQGCDRRVGEIAHCSQNQGDIDIYWMDGSAPIVGEGTIIVLHAR